MDEIERLAALERLATAARSTTAPDGPGGREIERDVATVLAALDDREAVPAVLEAVRIGPGEYAVPCGRW